MKFYDEFKLALSNALKTDFLALIQKMHNEHVYAGCLVVDEELSGMYLVFNTIEFLQKKDTLLFGADPFEEFRKMLSPEDFKKSFGVYDNQRMSTKWVYDDWGYGNNSLQYSMLNTINEQIIKRRDLFKTSEELGRFTKTIHDSMVYSLASLKDFIKGENGFDIFLYMSVVDFANIIKIENDSSKTLNDKDSYEEFIKRLITTPEAD